MKIVFLRAYDFPLGGAAQNRLLAICKGLIEYGHNVEVHLFAPAKLDLQLNALKSQVYKEIQIYNHSWKWSPAKSKLDKICGLLSGLIGTIIAILKSNHTEHIDYVFINNEKNYYIFPFFLTAKIIGARLGRDLNEYPLSVLSPERFNALHKRFKLITNYKWFDVLFIITNNLVNFYKPFVKRNSKILHLPVTVDFDRFPKQINSLNNLNQITYCGDLSQSKDGVLTLIRAFSLIKSEFPGIKLKLIGQNKDQNYNIKLKRLISDLNLSDNVILSGFVSPEEIPSELYKSRLLVLSRPDNIQSKGGFPTKLGEYLATGIPVAVTSVGEIPLYLKDGHNAFLAEPDNIESFACAMSRALIDDNLALKVGLAGLDTAKKYFSHKNQGKIISDFLLNID